MAKNKYNIAHTSKDYTNAWQKLTKKDSLHAVEFPDMIEEKFGLSRKKRGEMSALASCYIRALQQCEKHEPIDTECAEFLFAGHFLYGDICAREDFLLILTDFNAKKSDRFEEFLQYVPMLNRADITTISPDNFMRQEIIGLLYGGVKAGDGYCREALRILYKTFYKNEYNQIKRFSALHSTELIELCKDKEGKSIDILKTSRILCMAYVLDVQIDENCRPYYIAVSDMMAKIEEDEKNKQDSDSKVVIDGGLREDLQDSPRVDEIIKQTPKDGNGNFLVFDKINSVISHIFSDQGDFKKDYLLQSFPLDPNRAVEYLNAIISDMGLSGKFSNEDIVLMSPFIAVISAYATLTADYKDLLYSFLYPNSNLEANSSQIIDTLDRLKPANRAMHKELPISEIPADEPSKTEPQQNSLEDEIADLRRRLREKESECTELRIQCKKERDAKSELEVELGEWQSEKIELQRLRDYVYNETEDDVPEREISYEEMKRSIKDRNVIIIGGNENWTKKLKNEFPNWKFVGAIASPTVASGIIRNCEKIYFFTDTLLSLIHI